MASLHPTYYFLYLCLFNFFLVTKAAAPTWLSHCSPHPEPHNFSPGATQLQLVALRSIPLFQNTLVLALFNSSFPANRDGPKGPIAITATGRVLSVPPATFSSLVSVMHHSKRYGNTSTWVISHPHGRTNQPIDRIVFAPNSRNPNAKNYRQVTVHGYDGASKGLEKKTHGFYQVPDPLWSLLSVVMQGNEVGTAPSIDSHAGSSFDMVVLNRVKVLLRQMGIIE